MRDSDTGPDVAATALPADQQDGAAAANSAIVLEIDNLWRAERWDPEALIRRYEKAGAKYFVALANHHDNFDNFASRHHAWNSVNVGPRRDLIGERKRAAQRHGLRFGVSSHSAHAWWSRADQERDVQRSAAVARGPRAILATLQGAGDGDSIRRRTGP